MCVYFDKILNYHKYSYSFVRIGENRKEAWNELHTEFATRTHTASVRSFNRPSHKSVILRVCTRAFTCLVSVRTRDKVRAKSAQLHVPGKCVSALQRAAARSRPFKRMRADVLRISLRTRIAAWCTRIMAPVRAFAFTYALLALSPIAVTEIEFLLKECSIRITTHKLDDPAVNIAWTWDKSVKRRQFVTSRVYLF